MTIRVFGGDAGLWTSVRNLWIAGPDEAEGCGYEVERSRGYRDRLVVKLRGIDDATGAAQLRGSEVFVSSKDAAGLPPGVHYADRLVGLDVHDVRGRLLGRIRGVLPTGGTDLLRVVPRGDATEELLIPFAREYVSIDEEHGLVRVRLPKGLEELNRSGS